MSSGGEEYVVDTDKATGMVMEIPIIGGRAVGVWYAAGMCGIMVGEPSSPSGNNTWNRDTSDARTLSNTSVAWMPGGYNCTSEDIFSRFILMSRTISPCYNHLFERYFNIFNTV